MSNKNIPPIEAIKQVAELGNKILSPEDQAQRIKNQENNNKKYLYILCTFRWLQMVWHIKQLTGKCFRKEKYKSNN